MINRERFVWTDGQTGRQTDRQTDRRTLHIVWTGKFYPVMISKIGVALPNSFLIYHENNFWLSIVSWVFRKRVWNWNPFIIKRERLVLKSSQTDKQTGRSTPVNNNIEYIFTISWMFILALTLAFLNLHFSTTILELVF